MIELMQRRAWQCYGHTRIDGRRYGLSNTAVHIAPWIAAQWIWLAPSRRFTAVVHQRRDRQFLLRH